MKFLSRIFSAFRSSRGAFLNLSRSFSVNGSLRDNEAVGAIADVIATNVGKLTPQIIRKTTAGMNIKNDNLSRLLSLRPCPEMSIYDFLYKMASDLIYTSNAFAVLIYDNDFYNITAIQPISATQFSIFEDEKGNVLFRFVWDYDNKTYTLPYQHVIHVKARYNKKRFAGTPPDVQLKSTVELLNTTYEGIRNTVENSANLKGYLKYNNLVDDEILQDKVNEFKQAYMSSRNEGGIAGLDSTMDFKEITQRPANVPTPQITLFRENIYRYYHVNENILTSKYTEDEWNAFYESVIEPIAIQLSFEFTFKALSEGERKYGNSIVFIANRLQFATLQTRLEMGGNTFDRGVISVNEYRNLLYMAPIEGGDVRMISLNYVNTENQAEYQVGTTATDKPKEKKKGGEIVSSGKTGFILKSTSIADDNALQKINAYTRRELTAEDVYIFSVKLCDNEVDRDSECFTLESLKSLAGLFNGKTGIVDHKALVGNQASRIFETEIINEPNRLTSYGEPYTYLKANAYIMNTEGNTDLIANIDGGIIKEVSVSCLSQKRTCSICGTDWIKSYCEHRKGKDGMHIKLEDITDAYEFSFVAVPSQREAGVLKSHDDQLAQAQLDEEIRKNIQSLILKGILEGE